ncbi:MAG TPA: hypothetical protein VLH18_01660 [Candidatus Limnocylindrales bacterium]|nr:hypothetical protein [Candidatus Limnocylindrales bacterium]
MIKKTQATLILILLSLFVIFTLTGCAAETPAVEPEVPAEPEETAVVEEEPGPVELSFEAGEYINADYGFSVQYPVEWEIKPITEPSTIVFYATSADAVPLIFINVAEAASFEEALEVAIAAAEGSNVNIESTEDTQLPGGVSATKSIFKFKHPDAPLALNAIVVGTEKDGKWVTVTVATLGLIARFDEVLFSEIVHTLKFD